jgi:hypothetical protein
MGSYRIIEQETWRELLRKAWISLKVNLLESDTTIFPDIRSFALHIRTLMND